MQRARPGYGLLFEEGGAAEGSDPHHRWIVDPLDGTTNFLHGVPHFSISIALERDGDIIAGVVYDPTRDEMYWAEKGAGAYLNDRRLRVSARRQLGEALIATGLPFRGRPKHPAYNATLARVIERRAGSAGSARPRSTSPISRPDATTVIGSSRWRSGIWRPGCCWCAKPAALSAIWPADRA